VNKVFARIILSALAAGFCLSAFAAGPPEGRLLASQCFQCHGTNGQSKSGIDSIAGKNASELYKDLLEMKAKTTSDVMYQQAKVYTDAELKAIANYLATLPAGSSD